jgi:hypothetical protein
LFDLADKHYKEIINIYIGSNYSGLRDRAKIGLDDIREAQRVKVTPVEVTTPAIIVTPTYDLTVELEKLNKMRKGKIITEIEYKELRKAALEKAKSK